MLLKDLAGFGQFMDFNDENGAVLGDEAGAVVEVDLVLAEGISYGAEGAGLIGDFDSEDLEEGDHKATLFEAVDGLVQLVDEELHDAEAAVVGDGDPVDVHAGVGEDLGNASCLARLILNEDGE